MLYSILLIVGLVLAFRFYQKQSAGKTQEQKKKMLRLWGIAAIAVVVAILAFSKGNVIAGAIASLVALFSRAMPLLRFAPLIKSLFAQTANSSESSTSSVVAKPEMDKTEAASILGVELNASKEDIIAAHKKLIQKVHPDKGGSDALARQINNAKKILLDE